MTPCAGKLHLFFAPEGERSPTERVAQAKAICATCPHQTACLARALEHAYTQRGGTDVWAGHTTSELARMRHREGKARWRANRRGGDAA